MQFSCAFFYGCFVQPILFIHKSAEDEASFVVVTNPGCNQRHLGFRYGGLRLKNGDALIDRLSEPLVIRVDLGLTSTSFHGAPAFLAASSRSSGASVSDDGAFIGGAGATPFASKRTLASRLMRRR